MRFSKNKNDWMSSNPEKYAKSTERIKTTPFFGLDLNDFAYKYIIVLVNISKSKILPKNIKIESARERN
jgi:hypothetical protein